MGGCNSYCSVDCTQSPCMLKYGLFVDLGALALLKSFSVFVKLLIAVFNNFKCRLCRTLFAF